MEHFENLREKKEYLRYGIFRENMKKIQFLQETEQGSGVYGANHLADVSEQEFRRDYLGINLNKVNPAKSLAVIGREWMDRFHLFHLLGLKRSKKKNETIVFLKRFLKKINCYLKTVVLKTIV